MDSELDNLSSSVQDQVKDEKCYIHIIPDELLSAIFDTVPQSVDDEFSFPLMVSMVSLRWRQVAINTSSLWNSIFVNCCSYIRPIPHNFLLFFERSKAQPLYITLKLFDRSYSTSRFYKDLSEAIGKNTSHIREIVVCIEFLSDLHDFVSPFNNLAFPILSRLEIDSHGDQCFFKHVPLFPGAMHIQSLVFPKCPTCAPIGPDLTRLEIRTLPYNALRDIFQASPSLHTLSIYKFYNGRAWGEEDNPSPIVASSLHTLKLTIEEDHSSDVDGNCNCPLSRLVTPNLISLAVKLFWSGHFAFAQHFSTLPKIEELRIGGFTLTPEDGLSIQQWTTLTHLELDATDHTNLWSNPKASSSFDPWRNLTAVSLGDLSPAGRAQMVEAIRRSCAQSPRTIALNIHEWYRDKTEELRSELPNVVFNFIQPEYVPWVRYDTCYSRSESYASNSNYEGRRFGSEPSPQHHYDYDNWDGE